MPAATVDESGNESSEESSDDERRYAIGAYNPRVPTLNGKSNGNNLRPLIEASLDLPLSVSRRICPFCAEIMSPQRRLFSSPSDANNSLTAHINSSSCPFVRKNMAPGGGDFECLSCHRIFPLAKTVNIRFLMHLKMHDTELSCIYCDDKVAVASFFAHINLHASEASKSIDCKRCSITFSSARSFYEHFENNHSVKYPNLSTIKNHLPEAMDRRDLVVLAVFLCKYRK